MNILSRYAFYMMIICFFFCALAKPLFAVKKQAENRVNVAVAMLSQN